ncbi:MAG: hypothetical protein ACFFD2_24310 [Promethearchaeota archaeon]
MGKKNLKILGIILIFIFTLNIFTGIINQGIIPANNKKKSDEDSIINNRNEEIIKDELNNKESPKTSGPIELEQDYDFSFNTTIEDTWIYNYKDLNSTAPGDWMHQPDPKGYDVFFKLYITNLRNATGDLVNPDFFLGIIVQFWNFSKGSPDAFPVSNAPGLGNCTSQGRIYVNETMGAYFRLASFPSANYSATMYFNITRSKQIKTEFIPNTENTDSDLITWNIVDLQPKFIGDNYSINLVIENFTYFTLKSIAGKQGAYWQPVSSYAETATGIRIYDYFDEYSVELTTPNYISILYNANLTFVNRFTGTGDPDDHELHLYVTCKASGNLTIYFKNSTNDVNKFNQIVTKGEIVFYNYIMNETYPGGLGSLEISLINKSDKINFGVKTAEIMFYKNAIITAYSEDTTAFTDFFVLAGYIDIDKLWMLLILKFKGQITLTEDQILNQSSILNATVTYELESLAGELDYGYIPGIPLNVYNTIVDLKEFQIVPGDYNLTFRANKIGYTRTENITDIVISKKDVLMDIAITPLDRKIEIEENFAISIYCYVSVTYPPWYENHLRVPVNISVEILKDGKLDNKFLLPNVVQSYTIQGPMENDSIPGEYDLNISIISDYYQGNISVNVTVIKKPLEISVDYSGIIKESINKNFTWNLEEGNFMGNRENMTLEILIDNISTKNVSLASNSSGYNLFSFTPGVHNMTYRLISPFYTAEETIEFTVEAKTILAPPADDDDDGGNDNKEENLLFWLIAAIIIIGISCLAIWLLISRHKINVKRELESELIALKTKTTATEQKLSLIETQIAQIASIYWIIIVHSEQGTTMVEISDFRFGEVLDEEHKNLIGKGMMRDSALIGGFLTAIRNFSRETSGTSLEYQPVFNSQTDYSTIVDDNEIHRRILEGTNYFMAFVSSRGTIEISDVLSSVNTLFQEEYGEMVEKFAGAISPFRPFEEMVLDFLHNEIRELQKKLKEEELLLGQFEGHLKEVQEKIGIKPKKLN